MWLLPTPLNNHHRHGHGLLVKINLLIFILNIIQPTAESPVPVGEIPLSKSETTSAYPMYIGMYDYDAQTFDDLSFRKSDLMYIIYADKGDRWFARLKDSGEEGYISSNYVDKYNGYVKE